MASDPRPPDTATQMTGHAGGAVRRKIGRNYCGWAVVDTGVKLKEADDGDGRADGRELQFDGERRRPDPGRLLGGVVRSVPDVRADLREDVRAAPRRDLRQAGHRGRA